VFAEEKLGMQLGMLHLEASSVSKRVAVLLFLALFLLFLGGTLRFRLRTLKS
jgi:hypothetical protein